MNRLFALTLATLTVSLSALRAETDHQPSLFLTPALIAKLKIEIATDPNYRALWKGTLATATNLAANPPKLQGPDYNLKTNPRFFTEMPHIGDNVALLAFVYLITGDKKILTGCERTIEAILSYDPWGGGPNPNRDLEAGHMLAGLSLTYNWLYSDLDPSLRAKVKQALLAHGRLMYQGAIGTPPAHWMTSYLQNHQWVSLNGLLTAALALKDQEGIANKEIDSWIGIVKKDAIISASVLSSDGFSQEGPSYWSYGIERLMLTADLLRSHAGVDLFHNPDGTVPTAWKNMTLYRGYMALPRNSWTKNPSGFVNDIGSDMSARTDLYGSTILLKFAQEYKDSVAQQLAADVFAANMNYDGGISWLNYVWSDFSVPKMPFANFSTFHFFENMGVVSSRSSWDGNESMLTFKCGAPMGHDSIAKNKEDGGQRFLTYYNSPAHVHPDANTFSLFAEGAWMIRNSGYPEDGRRTAYDNTLTIDGQGQFGDGDTWLEGKHIVTEDPKLTVIHTDDSYDYLLGDATRAYDPKMGLARFQRHLLYFKKLNVILVLDDIQMNKPATLNLNFHFENPPNIEQTTNGVADVWSAQDPSQKSSFRLAKLDPTASSAIGVNTFMMKGKVISSKTSDAHSAVPHVAVNKGSLTYVTLQQKNCSSWMNPSALSWSSGTEQPPVVTATPGFAPGAWTFTVKSKDRTSSLAVNLAIRSVKIAK